MDDILTTWIAKNIITIFFILHIVRGIGDVMDDLEGTRWYQIMIRGIGTFLGKMSDVVAGAIEAMKPKRNGKPK